MIRRVALALAVTLATPGATLAWAAATAAALPRARLDVPIVRQTRERCGPAALQMVMGYYHANRAALAEAEKAYDPILRGALVTELAAAARRAGFEASIRTPGADSLAVFLRDGVPPILLTDVGFGPLQKWHYVVLVGWDAPRDRATIHDGSATPRTMSRAALSKRWRSAGGQALLVWHR